MEFTHFNNFHFNCDTSTTSSKDTVDLALTKLFYHNRQLVWIRFARLVPIIWDLSSKERRCQKQFELPELLAFITISNSN